MKKYLSLLLALLFSIGILAGCAQENPSNTDTESHEGNSETTAAPATPEKKYCEITIDDLFADDTVSLCLMPQYNDKAYTIEDFPELNISAMRETVFESFPENEPRRWIILTLSEPSKENVIAAIHALEKRADVYCAEPDSYSTPSATPNDILYNILWAPNKISLPSAWDITTGSSNIVVGIIDTGIDATHPDLTFRINRTLSKSFHNAYSSGIEDEDGHGTHVAGIIGAQGNNGSGIAGTCWNITLVSLRVANGNHTSDGRALFSDEAIADAIIYAEEKGIDILNFSGGGFGTHSRTRQAIQAYSGLIVCSAGNDANDNDQTHYYPADYDLDNIISVGASTSGDSMCSFSNYGNTCVDLFAPGGNISSCYPSELDSDGITTLSGTSMAAPFVTGVAALILSAKPNTTASALKSYLLNNTDYCNAFAGKCATNGRLNAYKALFAATHIHSYTHHYSSVSSTGHTAYCTCGDNISQAHTFTQSGNSLICTKCGYSSISLNNTDPEVELQ